MAEKDRPQITLITPPAFDWEAFPDTLARVLDAVEVACLRLPLAGTDEFELARRPMPRGWWRMAATWRW